MSIALIISLCTIPLSVYSIIRGLINLRDLKILLRESETLRRKYEQLSDCLHLLAKGEANTLVYDTETDMWTVTLV